jgi:hypothetical protein
VVDLARLAARHVLRGRRELRRHRRRDASIAASARSSGSATPSAAAHRDHLAHDGALQLADRGSAAIRPYGACARPEIAL